MNSRVLSIEILEQEFSYPRSLVAIFVFECQDFELINYTGILWENLSPYTGEGEGKRETAY